MPLQLDLWADEYHRLPRAVQDAADTWVRMHGFEPDITRGITFSGEGTAIAHLLKHDENGQVVTEMDGPHRRLVTVEVAFQPIDAPPWFTDNRGRRVMVGDPQ